MNVIGIIEIVIAILCIITYALMLYFKVKGNVVGAVSELIALAEKTGLSGTEKMAQVVDALYSKVPAFLKKILSKKRLQDIAQWIFEWMRKYAESYVEKAKEDATNEELTDTATEVGTEAIAELVAEMMNAGLKELNEIAIKKGVITDGLKSKKEYIEAIIKAVLNKA